MTSISGSASTPGKETQGNRSDKYFQERRRGEMNQLKNLLNTIINDPQSKKARDIVRKVIGYMTLGMDASPVFSEMCRASYTNDEVTKKMIYFYLTTYAQDNPDLAIMAVNTFKKDCKHSSSKVRGLALRNLCSFKSADYVNNCLPIIRELLHDFEPYVKKTAIMGLLKVFYFQPATIYDDQSIRDTLSSMIRDADSLVSVNAFVALNEILTSEGGVPLTSKLVIYLLHRLKEYNQWEQSAILDILYKYTPKDQKENYEIMSILWDKLKHSSVSLVMSSVKIIIKLAKQTDQLFKSVVEKIKAPLLTLMTGSENTGNFETSFVILTHIDYIISEMGGKQYYEKDFKYFYCRADEPTYTKQTKIKILGKLANEYNLGDMLNQLNDYVSDIDILIARKSIQVLASIAISLPEVAKALVINLVAFNRLEKPHLVNQTVIAYYNILRKHHNLFNQLKAALLSSQNMINQPESLCAFLWIVGTFAQNINDAPYILQDYVTGNVDALSGQFQQYPDELQSIILTQTVQIFLKRPPETINTLKMVLKLILMGDNVSVLLKDHASFYYRALRDNPQDVKRGFYSINSEMGITAEQTWGNSAEDQFNNLSIIYKKKENKFIKNYQYFLAMRNKELGLIEPKTDEDQEEQHENLADMDFGQLESEKFVYNPLEAHNLQQSQSLSADQFQDTWNSLTEYSQVNAQLNLQNLEYLEEEAIEELFKMWHIYSIASAEDNNVLKFYMYGRHLDGEYFCLEIKMDKGDNSFSLGTKANKTDLLQGASNYICEFLVLNQFIILSE